jgi:aquaporin Z
MAGHAASNLHMTGAVAQPSSAFPQDAAAGPGEAARHSFGPLAALRRHWPEYLMEGAELGVFMISACAVVALLEHPGSPVSRNIINPNVRRMLTGMAMGLTAIAIVYSPWGKQSGAHFNPSVTLTFWRLGKVAGWDAVFYVVAQSIGAVIGVLIAAGLLGQRIRHPSVNYVATLPGPYGVGVAFFAELLISFGLMSVVLTVSNTTALARATGLFCGVIVATYISLEAPLSGMSMNPARSFGPAAVSQMWTGFWIYCVAPPLGMLTAAEAYVRLQGAGRVACAKLHHQNSRRCIFCDYQHGPRSNVQSPPSHPGGVVPPLDVGL